MYTKFKIKLGMYKDEFLNVAAEKAEKDSPAKKYSKSPAKKKGCSKKY